MKNEDVDTTVWIIGLILLCTGGALYWGWPAILVVLGAILSIWPLVKQIR